MEESVFNKAASLKNQIQTTQNKINLLQGAINKLSTKKHHFVTNTKFGEVDEVSDLIYNYESIFEENSTTYFNNLLQEKLIKKWVEKRQELSNILKDLQQKFDDL